MTTPSLLPLTAAELAHAMARSALFDDLREGARAACARVFQLRGEWHRTPLSSEVAAMLTALASAPEPAAEPEAVRLLRDFCAAYHNSDDPWPCVQAAESALRERGGGCP